MCCSCNGFSPSPGEYPPLLSACRGPIQAPRGAPQLRPPPPTCSGRRGPLRPGWVALSCHICVRSPWHSRHIAGNPLPGATRFSPPPPARPPSTFPDALGGGTWGGTCSPRCHSFWASWQRCLRKSLSCQVTGCDDGAAGKTSKQPKQSEIVCREWALKLAFWISTRLTPGAFVRRAGLSSNDGEGPNLASYL